MYYFVLDRYIAKVILHNIGFVLFILISLSSIIKFVDELRKINHGHYAFCEISIYVFLSIVKDVELFLPMAILIGSLLGLGIFSERNELIVMEAFGFSRLQIVLSLMKAACPVILFGIFISEWAAPISECISKNYRSKAMHHVIDSVVVFKAENLWLKEKNSFILIEQVVTFSKLLGVHVYYFDQKNRLNILSYASSAIFSDGFWNLSNVSRFDFDSSFRIVMNTLDNEVWSTVMTPDVLSLIIMFIDSTSYSVYNLYRYVRYLHATGQDSSRYRLYFWEKIFAPMSVIVMMLVAISCVFIVVPRKFDIGLHIAVGVFFSFIFYVLTRVFSILSVVYNILPIVGAILPILIFLILSVIILYKVSY